MDILLGKKTDYIFEYNPQILTPIPRELGRSNLSDTNKFIANGFDIWNCYELSWLNTKKKPEVRILEFHVPASSKNIVESKSVKLYLNSFNNTVFDDEAQVKIFIEKDLSAATESTVLVNIKNFQSFRKQSLACFDGICLDNLEIEITDFKVNKELLQIASSSQIVKEILYSDLFKSNCLATKQPDWASIKLDHICPKIDHQSLLKYLISYRNHDGFHEHCVEHVFYDLYNLLNPKQLIVYARYTRRGGIDINPIRSTLDLNATEVNNFRQIRQ